MSIHLETLKVIHITLPTPAQARRWKRDRENGICVDTSTGQDTFQMTISVYGPRSIYGSRKPNST